MVVPMKKLLHVILAVGFLAGLVVILQELYDSRIQERQIADQQRRDKFLSRGCTSHSRVDPRTGSGYQVWICPDAPRDEFPDR